MSNEIKQDQLVDQDWTVIKTDLCHFVSNVKASTEIEAENKAIRVDQWEEVMKDTDFSCSYEAVPVEKPVEQEWQVVRGEDVMYSCVVSAKSKEEAELKAIKLDQWVNLCRNRQAAQLYRAEPRFE